MTHSTPISQAAFRFSNLAAPLCWLIVVMPTLFAQTKVASPTPTAKQANGQPGVKVSYRQPPVFESLSQSKILLASEGLIGERLVANRNSWLRAAPEANPAMLQMFHDRDRKPPRDLLPWSGEFAGKYLISLVHSLRVQPSASDVEFTQAFVRQLIAAQHPSGYFGPFPTSERMTGKGRWDLWGQYHVMLGLFRWYELNGDQAALASACKCADHFCDEFLTGNRRVVSAGSEEMNQAVIHILLLLYRQTGTERYLKLAREVEKDFETPPSGDYVRTALAGTPFFKTPKPRWESLHPIQGIAELYFLTGDEKYRKAYEQICWSIAEGDRHNTGGFSSGEQATGNPYDPKPIETCCTIAWNCALVDWLRMTGNPLIADELELSLYNGVLGAQHPSGRWWTYNTPMDGDRKASAHEIVFQARPGSPELNCCSVNGPRGIGMIEQWLIMQSSKGFALNGFVTGKWTIKHAGNDVEVSVDARDYLRNGAVSVQINNTSTQPIDVQIRIPQWSEQTSASVTRAHYSKRGEFDVRTLKPGTYWTVTCRESESTSISLQFDWSPWCWVGERDSAGKVSIYAGPILFAFDPVANPIDLPDLPAIDLSKPVKLVSNSKQPLPTLTVEAFIQRELTLVPYVSAGVTGSSYRTWLKAESAPKPAAFSRSNPLRRVKLPTATAKGTP